MSATPFKMKAGMAVAIIGAIWSFILMSQAWDGSLDSVYVVGLAMFVCVMFFATAGAFTKFCPVKGSTVLVLSVVTAAVVILAMVYEAIPLIEGIILVILAIVCIVCGACPGVVSWVDECRDA